MSLLDVRNPAGLQAEKVDRGLTQCVDWERFYVVEEYADGSTNEEE